MEQWKTIPGHADYAVSNEGNVKRITGGVNTYPGRRKKAAKSGNGYMIVGLYSYGKRTNILVHRAVAAAFIGPIPDMHEVNHIDGDKTNNSISNLEYVTRSANSKHAIKLGLHTPPTKRARGADHWTRRNPEKLARGDANGARKHPDRIKRGQQCPASKLTEQAVREIKALLHSSDDAELGKRFSVTRRTINNIRGNRTWKHVK